MKKISLLIAGILVVVTIPLPDRVSAATGIADCEDLQNMQDDLDGSYVLTADIDCDGYGFTPVGEDGDPFTGAFDGDGHTISNLTTSQSLGAGLFGQVWGGSVRDVFLRDFTVSGTMSVGTIAGETVDSAVSNIGVDGFSVSGDQVVGGLIGNVSGGSIRNSYTMNGTVEADRRHAGGLIGSIYAANVTDAYSVNSTIRQEAGGFFMFEYVGGLIGRAQTDYPGLLISNVYSDNTVQAGSTAGGIVGLMSGSVSQCDVENAFFAGNVSADSIDGQIVGYIAATCNISNAFYLSGDCAGSSATSGTVSCSAAAGISDFYDAENEPLASWDFDVVWMEVDDAFPAFIWTDPARPEAPSDVEISTSDSSATLQWTNDDGMDFDSVTIRRSTTGYPSTASGGTAVASGLTGTTYTDTGLVSGTRYYYSLFTKNDSGLYSLPSYATDIIGRNACMLEAYWKFDATPSAPADATGNGYDGTGSGAVTLSEDVPTTGFVNPYSYAFSGARIDVDRPVQDDFTICAWVKTTAQGAGTGGQHYLSMAIAHSETGGGANDFGFGMDANERLTFGNGNVANDFGVHGSTTINTGEWTHVCATRQKENGAIKLYVDGEEDASGTGSTTSLTANSDMTIGHGADGALYWNGSIDDVRVYAYALRADEIADIANGVDACFGEAAPRSSGSGSSSSANDAPQRQSGGGRRGSPGRGGSAPSIGMSRASANSAISRAPLSSLRTAGPRETMPAGIRERTCERVMKWFKDDAKMLGRVNARLENRFGFTCQA